ncbi:MAG TPA: endolytic transglycosylase MltG [Deltaproteobacteria bacterium]|nr:endolytic transglycosylase MltG [Deltaproteobacteria bacterium]
MPQFSRASLALTLLVSLSGCDLAKAHFGAAPGPANADPVVFEVPAGSSARGLAPALEAIGLVGSADNFVMYVRLTKEGGCIKAGRHEVSASMDAGDLITALCGVPLANDVPFTVVEGWRIREIDAALAEKGWTKPGEYSAAVADPGQYTAPFPLPATSIEGYLFPETYMVDAEKWDTKGFVQRQIDLLAERFYTPNRSALESSGRSFAEVVIMASMLEREEPTKAQRPLVAGILWKRIDSQWNLGVDATSRYTLDKWNDRRAFLKKLRDPSDRYNTRLRGGLPPTAIGNPGMTALDAALHPTKSEFWYYLHDSSGVIHPSRNVGEHEAYRKKYNVY